MHGLGRRLKVAAWDIGHQVGDDCLELGIKKALDPNEIASQLVESGQICRFQSYSERHNVAALGLSRIAGRP